MVQALNIFYFSLHLSDVAFFSEALERYHGQHKQAEAIKEKRPIGMLLVDAIKMKSLLIPSPLRCLNVSKKYIQCSPFIMLFRDP